MARETIASLNYQVFLDTIGLKQGSKEAKSSFNQLKRSARVAEDGADRLQKELDNLAKLARQGVPTALKTLNKRLDQTGKKLNRHGKVVDKLGTRWKKAQTNLKGMVFNMKALAGLVVGGAVARGFSQQIERLDEMAKAARALGTDVEFMSTLQFRASQDLGLSFDETANAIRRMVTEVGKGTVGMGRAKKLFEEYNIELSQFKGLNPEELFRALSVELANVTNEQDKTVIGAALFGDQAARMFDLMQQIAGVDMTQGMVTTQQATNAEQMADALGVMANEWDQLTLKLGELVSPGLLQLLTAVNDTLDRLFPENEATEGRPTANITRRTTVGDTFGGLLSGSGMTLEQLAQGNLGAAFGQFGNVMNEIDRYKNDRIAQENANYQAQVTAYLATIAKNSQGPINTNPAQPQGALQ